MSETANYYSLLGVAPTASPEEITVAFRRQVERFPEQARDPTSNPVFRLLVAAYKVLSDPERRERFDMAIGTQIISGPQALNMQFLASQPVLPAMAEPQVLYLLLDISANPSLANQETPLNLCLVIDRSTSMEGARMNQVRVAASLLVDHLKPTDTIAVISFSDFAEIVVPSSAARNPQAVQSRISQLSTGGATEIYQGLHLGITELQKAKGMAGISHLILLTDGHTYGDEQKSMELAQRAAENGIGISAFGIGNQWNDTFLDALLAPSGSTSCYLESPQEIVTHLEKRFRALNRTFAQDVQLRLQFPPDIELNSLHKLSPFPHPVAYSRWSTPLGILQQNVPLSVLMEAVIHPQEPSSSVYLRGEVNADIVATGERHQRFTCQLKLDFAVNPPKKPPLPAVVRAVSKLSLYQMNEKAWEEISRGEVDQATRRMSKLGTRLLQEGQTQLARTAFSEATRISHTGRISDAGRKRLKYGTRSLIGYDNVPRM